MRNGTKGEERTIGKTMKNQQLVQRIEKLCRGVHEKHPFKKYFRGFFYKRQNGRNHLFLSQNNSFDGLFEAVRTLFLTFSQLPE